MGEFLGGIAVALERSRPCTVKGISNNRLPEPRFGFDKSLETLTRVWQGELEYLKPNIRIFDIDYRCRHHHLASRWTRPRIIFFSFDDFTSKFIEINGNPSILHVIDCTRTHHDTQINEIIKITYKINPFTLPRHRLLKICFSLLTRPNPSMQRHPFE